MSPPSAEDVSKLLLTLYEAPMRPELWGNFLKRFTELLGRKRSKSHTLPGPGIA
jgi:hypothetical protein